RCAGRVRGAHGRRPRAGVRPGGRRRGPQGRRGRGHGHRDGVVAAEIAVTSTRYDRIGTSYTRTRRTEPRVAAQIHAALGDARRVVNVGAGTGSYEPAD